MISAENTTSDSPNRTFWENAAETRWGNYITEIERRMLVNAADSFARPGVGFEIGCEGGRWTQLLVDRGWQMTATDVDAVAIAVCKERNPVVNCIVVNPEDTELPAETESVDLLLCLEVPPVTSAAWAYREASRILKPGGRMVGTLNNLCSWRGAAVTMKSRLRRSRHFYMVTYRKLQRSLAENGIVIDATRGCCWAPFGRHSDSRLVPAATALERSLGLQSLPSVSPWVVFSATRR